jgi:hypothetical protein
VIVLQTDDLLVRADPAHGGEILDLVNVRTGAQYLGRPPFAPLPPLAGDLDEDTWTDRYRGGWQTVAPNAGNACAVDGIHHGFHGAASTGVWSVADAGRDAATFEWEGGGLAVSRRLAIEGGGLAVETTWRAISSPAPLIWVEHFTVGVQLLSPEVEIQLPGGRGYELSEIDGPAQPPDGAPGWPDMLLLDGSIERLDRWSLDRPHARFGCIADLPSGRLEVRNAAIGDGLALEWDVEVLPHLWIWHEVRTSGGRWRQQAEVLGLEPASVPHSLGLARALAESQARIVEPGTDLSCRLVVRLLDGGSPS